MATLYVRNFPDALYETVKELAREDRQSIRAKVIELITEAVERKQRRRRRLEAMAILEEMDKHFHPLNDGKDSVALLREDRDR
ncbi:MAG: hypothetical protein ACYDCO_12860 [Armatimonadota bacterium]